LAGFRAVPRQGAAETSCTMPPGWCVFSPRANRTARPS
jgi:hypothetical protein